MRGSVFVNSKKSAKELAFLYDLFIAPDWGERFAELIDEHLRPPAEGKALYVAVGTGGHALALQERAGEKLELLCLDENAACLELARAKATAANDKAEFRVAQLNQLELTDNQFDLVLGNASLLARQRVRKVFSEMVRVAAPGAMIVLALPTSSSFGEFFSIYWEALHNIGLISHESDVEHLITELPTVSEVERMADDEGLENIASWTRIEEFDFESGEQFESSPLVAEFLIQDWLASVPEESMEEVLREVSRIINEERHEAEFALTVKATLLVGRKTHSH
jgi:ubiquinone/menaquinone biosynthesis C-methylase UbiE